jgi:hypothetical protein
MDAAADPDNGCRDAKQGEGGFGALAIHDSSLWIHRNFSITRGRVADSGDARRLSQIGKFRSCHAVCAVVVGRGPR